LPRTASRNPGIQLRATNVSMRLLRETFFVSVQGGHQKAGAISVMAGLQ